MKNVKVVFMSVALCLSACSVPKENFDCPPGAGVGCRSISQVNELLNQGSLNAGTPKIHAQNVVFDPRPSSAFLAPDILDSDALNIERIPEAHLRVWIAPFQDSQGYFHEGSVIHTVLSPGLWQVEAS